MRIHVNNVTETDLRNILTGSDLLRGVKFLQLTPHVSRTHERAFEVRLTGSSHHRTMKGEHEAATWDEWGVFINEVFNLDPTAKAGDYKTQIQFDQYTVFRFDEIRDRSEMCTQHKWGRFSFGYTHCVKCEARIQPGAFRSA